MRRLLALLPALCLLAMVPSAGAAVHPWLTVRGSEAKTVACKGTGETGSVTATVNWAKVPKADGKVLIGLSVTSTCVSHYASVEFFWHASDQVRLPTIAVAPGATKTLGEWGLEHNLLHWYDYRHWVVRSDSRMTEPCVAGIDTTGLIDPNGKVTKNPCGMPPDPGLIAGESR